MDWYEDDYCVLCREVGYANCTCIWCDVCADWYPEEDGQCPWH